MSLNAVSNEPASKAKRILFSLLLSLYDYGQLPSNIYFKLLNAKILQVLLYGTELWGFKPRENCELIYRFACKRFLCVNKTSSNSLVLGDCGRYPL